MLNSGDVIGNYQIESTIGKGGMGMVFLAYDLRLERQVAVKVINSEKYDDSENKHINERFAIEAKALAKLNDPHIVQIFDFDPDHQPPFLVMEYVTGRNLIQLIHRDKCIPIVQVLDAAVQILAGLSAAHKLGVIHRDIKPSNILLASNGTYKLVDFGLARRHQSSPHHEALTEDDTVLGTLQYLAPEAAQGQAATQQGDLYSLGVTLFHMATGHTPHESNNKLELLKFIANDPAPSISKHLDNLPPPLIAWFDTLLAYQCADRFESCNAALEKLHEIAGSINLTGLRETIQSNTNSQSFISDAGSQDTVLLSGQAQSRSEQKIGTGSGSSLASSIQITSHRPDATASFSAPDLKLKKKKKRLNISFSLKMVIALWFISSIGSFFAIKYIADETLYEQMAQLKSYLKTSAHSATLLIDGDTHQTIKTRDDVTTPAFYQTLTALTAFRDANPDILNIYTMAPTPKTEAYGIVQFICDASPLEDTNGNNFIDDDESVAEIGEEYNAGANAPALLKGFNEVCTDENITTDKWGAVLSGYAPIYNRTGESVGLVGVDVSSDKILAIRARSNNRALLVQLLSFFTFLIAALIVANRFKRPIQSLQKSLAAAADGDYSVDVKLDGSSEFLPLAQSINIMLEELREKDTLRKGYELFVAREMHSNISGNTSSTSISNESLHQIHVLCTFDTHAKKSAIQEYEKILSKTISVFFDHGGIVDQMLGNGILVTFEENTQQHAAEETAIRAALQAQFIFNNQSSNGQLTISIHSGLDENHKLLCAINKIGAELHTDILISDTVFKPVQMMFYADCLNDVDIPGHSLSQLYAIKGSVSVSNDNIQVKDPFDV